MFRKDQFGIVFNTIFAIMFAIFLPMYITGSNMYREMGMVLWGPLFQQLTLDFIPAFAVTFAIGTYIDLKAMGDGFARLCGVKNENGLLFHILRVASITFVMTFLMSLIMMFIAWWWPSSPSPSECLSPWPCARSPPRACPTIPEPSLF